MAKLVAIGDSITQGVMSAAISKTKLSYPALIAKALGLKVWMPDGKNKKPTHQNVFRVPYFPGSGLPLNIEELFKAIGPDFDDCMDINELTDRLSSISKFIKEVRKSNKLSKVNYDGIYHNLAVLSFRVFDSFTINSECYAKLIKENEKDYAKLIKENEKDFDKKLRRWQWALFIFIAASRANPKIALGFVKWIDKKLNKILTQSTSFLVYASSLIDLYLERFDDVDKDPSATKYRVARHVLNPSQNPARERWTQICNLKHIMETDEEGVENLILFLGANDCLGTVRDLEIKDMKGHNVGDDLEDRRRYNLTSEAVFRRDYERMVCQISEIISETTNVFVGTIPYVTIPPLTQASNEEYCMHNGRQYFTRYDPFFVNGEEKSSLTGKNAIHIDDRIDKFNKIIRNVIQTLPKKGNWRPVEIGCLLNKLAIKRASDNPCNDPDKPLKDLLPCNHELLSDNLAPVPNVLRLQTENNERTEGGIFSLDCFHPTTIGQGLIAREFVSAMKCAGVSHVDSDKSDWDLDWEMIIENDTLLQDPPELWDEAVNLAKDHSGIADLIYRILM